MNTELFTNLATVDLKQAIQLLLNIREPNIYGIFFLHSHSNPICRYFDETPEQKLTTLAELIRRGIVDRWIGSMDGMIQDEDGHTLRFQPAPRGFPIPTIHISARFLVQARCMGDEALVFFFIVRGTALRAKLMVKHRLHDAIVAMLDEAIHGYATVFCGAMLRPEGLEFFNPNARRRDWRIVPVVEFGKDPHNLPKAAEEGLDSVNWVRPAIRVLC